MKEIIICIIAGLGAGLGTGFAGMSAAVVIAPLLITFLGVDPYLAVGIALASDVLASAASAVMYAKNKNIDIKNGLLMMVSVLLFTFVGSFIASLTSATLMGNFSLFITIILGLKFIIKPVTAPKKRFESLSQKKKYILSVLCGAFVGFICGFVGAGGGMMMLMVLVMVLGYELKCAVGTSVFIMSFTALTGAISHFTLGVFPSPTIFITCIISTLVFALIAAKLANKVNPIVMNRITGAILVILGISMVIVNYGI